MELKFCDTDIAALRDLFFDYGVVTRPKAPLAVPHPLLTFLRAQRKLLRHFPTASLDKLVVLAQCVAPEGALEITYDKGQFRIRNVFDQSNDFALTVGASHVKAWSELCEKVTAQVFGQKPGGMLSLQ